MAGYDQDIRILTKYVPEGKKFFSFLQAVGKKYSRPVKIRYKYLGRGKFYVTIDGGPGSIDALFQELILNRGLYYYICSIEKDKKIIIDNVIIPIYGDLIENRFQNPYRKFLKKHILGKISPAEFVPGDFYNSFSHEYEILFRKWDLGLITKEDFIVDIDSLLTKFMLTNLSHKSGDVSQDFEKVLNAVYQKGIGMVRETRKFFSDIHKERKNILHRLSSISDDRVLELGSQLYNYFQYFDEFEQSQKEKTEKMHGKFYKRIKYGDEEWLDENGKPFKDDDGKDITMDMITQRPCHDCACVKGQYHCSGCDAEICPRCGGQRLGCGCKLNKDFI